MTRCLVLITRVYLEPGVVPTTTIMTELKFQRHRLNTVVMSDHMMHHSLWIFICLSYCTVFVLVNSYELRESGKILSSALMKWYCSEPLLESLCECIWDSLWLIDQGKSHSSESGVISASSLLTEHAGKQTYLQEPLNFSVETRNIGEWTLWQHTSLFSNKSSVTYPSFFIMYTHFWPIYCLF